MAIYAVGDIQGCYQPLQALLAKVKFDANKDVLWCCGDVVNRGPESLEVLRFLKSLGDACVCVLGNHDLQLLAYAAGGKSFEGDTLDVVLKASDSDELIEWLRFRPLLHHDKGLGWCMVHAGLSPLWTLNKSKSYACRLEEMLRSDQWGEHCQMMQEKPFPTQDSEDKDIQHMFAAAVLMRTRFCSATGVFDWQQKTAQPKNNQQHTEVLKPWFEHDTAMWKQDCRIVFGHWAAKGLVNNQPHALGLDTACVWGGELTIARLGQGREVQLFSEPSGYKAIYA